MVAIERNNKRDTYKIETYLSLNGIIEIPKNYLRLLEIRDRKGKFIIDYMVAPKEFYGRPIEYIKRTICNEKGIVSRGQVVYFEGKFTSEAVLIRDCQSVVAVGEEVFIPKLSCGSKYEIPETSVVPTGMNDSEKILWVSKRHRLYGEGLYACDIDGWMMSCSNPVCFEFKWMKESDKPITYSERIMAGYLEKKGIPLYSVFYNIGVGWYGDQYERDMFKIRGENEACRKVPLEKMPIEEYNKIVGDLL